MNTYSSFIVLLILILPDVLGQQVRAVDAVKVNYRSSNGSITGSFVKNGEVWTESNSAGTYSYVQINNDEWSLYLRDASRNLVLQIDLSQMKVYRDPFGNGRAVIYYVSSVESAKKGHTKFNECKNCDSPIDVAGSPAKRGPTRID